MNTLSSTARQNCLVGTAHCFILRTLSSQWAHFCYPEVRHRGSRNSVIGTVIRLRSGWYGPRKPARASPNHPHRLWGPPSLPDSKYRSSFLRIRQPRRDVGHWPPSSAEVKNEWSWNSAACICRHGVHKEPLSSLLACKGHIQKTNIFDPVFRLIQAVVILGLYTV